MAAEGYIEVPGGRVWYRRVGQGGVPLLCLHGGPGFTHFYWNVWKTWRTFGITADPSHTLTVRLGSRDIERGAGGVEAGYLKAAIGQQKGERVIDRGQPD